MRLLLFGKNGQVGWELQETLRPLGKIQALDYPEVDFMDLSRLRQIVRESEPDLIVNAAAYTAVDRAESEPEKAMTINAEAPGVLAETAFELGVGLVHFSTDYVFDGTKQAPYTEDDQPNPLSVYGASKLAGDEVILQSGCEHLIQRTSWVYGARGKNFFLTMLRLAREQEVIRVVDDQIGSPTWSQAIAQVTAQVLLSAYNKERDRIAWGEGIASGVYNYSAMGSTSWYGFALQILKNDPEKHEHTVKRISPISTVEFGASAARPAYSELSKAKLGRVFGLQPERWKDQLQACWQAYSG